MELKEPYEETKRKGPLIEPALCRCCRSIKNCRLLTHEYEWMGQKEVYSDMIIDCFGLLLSCLDGEDKDRCICATCVGRLREACAFRKQVLNWEEAFLQMKLNADKDETKIEVEIKAEPVTSDSDSNDYVDDDFTKEVTDTKEYKEVKQKLEKKNTKKRKSNMKKDLLKKRLLNNINKLKHKLNKELVKEDSLTKKKENESEQMAYRNTITIITNSYVCPFENRVSNYYCYYCKDQFVNPNELREHTLTHDPKEYIQIGMKKNPKIDVTRIDCRLCSIKIDDVESFKQHITSAHKMAVHDVKNEFLKFKLTLNCLSCTECGTSFPYFDLLKKHMAVHFGTYTCDSCGACFLEENSLLTHIKKHAKKNGESNFPCEICGKNLKSKYSRYNHITTVHEKKATVNCYKCEESFLSHALRNRHLIEVHGDSRTFPCKLCDKVYTRRKTLSEHNRRNHLKVYKHQCELCDQKFYLPSRLKDHMVTHTGERNFRCEFCEKSYPRLKSLREHMRTHTNDRRFKCTLCNSSFTQNGSLKSHLRSHHQDFALESYS